MTKTTERYTADVQKAEPKFTSDQLNELARVIERDYSNMGNVYWALKQAATDATTLQSLRDENARLRDALNVIAEGDSWRSGNTDQAIARNALKED